MDTRICNLIILDASGSMGAIRKQAVSGLNETVQTIREARRKHGDQLHHVTIVSFNSCETRKLYDMEPVSEVRELNHEDFRPVGLTPLYDAMGSSLTELRRHTCSDDRVLVTVITDGEENDSREYSGKTIAGLVADLKAEGWIFTYIGANQDVEKAASGINITNCIRFDATEKGADRMFSMEISARTRFFDRIANMHNNVDSVLMNEDYYNQNQ